jgi:hypothetical protein
MNNKGPGMLLSFQTYHIRLSSITAVLETVEYLNVGVRELAKTKKEYIAR